MTTNTCKDCGNPVPIERWWSDICDPCLRLAIENGIYCEWCTAELPECKHNEATTCEDCTDGTWDECDMCGEMVPSLCITYVGSKWVCDKCQGVLP